MNIRQSLFALGALVSISQAHGAAGTGSVTPTSLTVTFTSVAVIDATNHYITLLSGTFPTTFNRADSNLAGVSMGNINLPAGRYIGVALGLNFSYSVVVNGALYHGTTTGGYTDGTSLLYSVGTTASANGSVQPSATPLTAVTSNGLGPVGGTGGNTAGSTISYFGNVICVTPDGTGCQSTDTVLGNSASASAELDVMMDLYNAVSIDTTNNAMAINNTYPVPTLGKPGVAIHLQSSSTTGGEWMAIFSSTKQLLSTRGFISNQNSGLPSGGPFVTATAGPTVNNYGVTTVQLFTAATDLIQIPMAGSYCSGLACNNSNGFVTFSGITSQPVDSTVKVSCTADSTGALGYTYTGGDCSQIGGQTTQANTTMTYKIVRIVDSGNVFGQCGATSRGYLSGGTCVSVNNSAASYAGGYF